MDHKTLYREVIKSFFLAFKRLSLYAVDHPLSQDILKNLFKMYDELLKDQKEILIVMGAGVGQIFVNQEVIEGDTLGVVEVSEKFALLKMDGVSFLQGLTVEELTDFVHALAQASVLDGGKEVEIPAVVQEGSAHVQIKKIRYERVEDGEKVVDEGAAEGKGKGPGGAPGGGRMKVLEDIKDFLTGREKSIATTPEDVFKELEHGVSGVAEAIIASAKESGDFEAVVTKFIVWMSQYVLPIIIEHKRDPAKFIQRLFDSFKKEEGLDYFPDAQEVITDCADDIMVSMLEQAYDTYGASAKKGMNLAAKLLVDEDDQARLTPKLQKRLEQKGADKEAVGAFLKKVEAELAKDEDVAISKKKLAKLTRLADRFEEEVDQRVRAATEKLVRANTRLADEKERAEGVMRYLADGLVVVDKTGNVVMMNPAAEKLLDTETQESIGKSLAASIKDQHLLAMAKGDLSDSDEMHITKEIHLDSKNEDVKRILKASSAVVENENGKPIGMVAVLSDITHEKEVEEMKSHFVSLVTHELRTPVVAVQKSIELLLSQATGALSEDQQRFLSMSKFNVERLNKLINDLLDMSRLEAGRFTLNPVEFDLCGLVRDAQTSLMTWAKDKEITFRMEMPPDKLSLSADRDRLMQVLVNLIGNALKFTPAKGEVGIRVRPLEKKEGICEEPCLEVCVADTGIGIDPKDFKRIFSKFEQVSLVAPHGAGGTGLGLPISKEIINLHGGTIWVESEKNKGSRFIFVVPRSSGTSLSGGENDGCEKKA